KPMNCPESTVIYKTKTRSYRDLPLRLSEYGRLHRNELSGTLSGLTRVRHFIQDDGHIYVRPDQIESEIDALLGEVATVYGWFDLPVEFVFSTKPAKALGDPKLWEKAESMIESALKRSGATWRLSPGDGAFYAPKIDIIVRDALGREWQTATIQVDLAMLPERFDLEYVDEAGERVRPIAIHRAIYGSLERFIGILVEHFAGALPLWLSPEQVVIIPIADRHLDAAKAGAAILRRAGIRVSIDDSSNRMQNKIRLAQEQKVPLMLVLGDKEIEAGGAAPRWRDGSQEPATSWDALAARLAALVSSRSVS
ncbi:MAG: aminoacyl--tRNA ligase-related protein, partial [Candidatus Limnocylindrus sp.]